MRSNSTTVREYLGGLSADRRAAIGPVRRTILENLDKDYREGMQYGMIGYAVPHRVYPAGYHCDPSQPLCFAMLGAQKNHCSLYLMSVYGSEKERAWFEAAWKKTGKKLDMGRACIRFTSADELALDVIGEAVRRVPARAYIESVEKILAGRAGPGGKKGSGPPKKAAKKTAKRAAKKTAKKTAKRAAGEARGRA
jgi:hypothetical protein